MDKTKEVEFTILPLVTPSYGRESSIDIEKIREYAACSFDEYPPEDRALAWLALLHVYPNDPTKWVSTYQNIKKTYWDFVSLHNLSNWHTLNIPGQINYESLPVESKSLMGIIHGDIVRTGKSIFCFKPSPIPLKEGEKVSPADDAMYQFAGDSRRLERILYVFSSLNKGLGYMQGYNEILPPFYYVFNSAISLFNNDIDLVEALSFECFQVLLTQTRLNEFYTTADKSSIIMHRLSEFSELVQKNLPEVAQIIKELDIHPVLYCYRWFNLLFSQEHDFSTLLLIWDDLFAHFDELMDFVYYVGLGHLKELLVQNKIQRKNYQKTLQNLQNMEGLNIKNILVYANKMWEASHKIPTLERFRKLFF